MDARRQQGSQTCEFGRQDTGVAKQGTDLEKLRSARTSANSAIRQCKALFSSERLELLGLSEIQSPFEKVKLDPAGDLRFKGGINAEKLVHAAFAELACDPECLKAFILSIACGLRRSEADKLEWAAIDFDRGLLHVGPTKFLHPKSEKSIGDVDLDEGTVALFRGFHAKRQSNFVLESEITPRLSAGFLTIGQRKPLNDYRGGCEAMASQVGRRCISPEYPVTVMTPVVTLGKSAFEFLSF